MAILLRDDAGNVIDVSGHVERPLSMEELENYDPLPDDVEDIEPDFRIVGDTEPNLMYVDFPIDREGIGVARVDDRVHIGYSSFGEPLSKVVGSLHDDHAKLAAELNSLANTVQIQQLRLDALVEQLRGETARVIELMRTQADDLIARLSAPRDDAGGDM